MAMNREQKRALKKQGELSDDGEFAPRRREAPSRQLREERTSPAQFLKEVRAELRKVAWPSRSETINYSVIVLVTITVLTALVFALDWVFAEFVLSLFDTN
ncbi:MAG: preprotein translocase subunit SecE [Acidimicrobiia bacterium]|nr:preprotein translocase subunit SecE [Acidimicrobiia bacterium]MDH5237398.1 preprotein translocase subunit SecE [Acidimicrobiia bacterium]